MRFGSLLVLLSLLAAGSFAQNYVSLNNKGNKAYNDGEYKEALDYYNQAEVEQPETPEILYNQGNALIGMGQYEEATEKLQQALTTDDVNLQADAYFNLGNSFFDQQRFQNAIQMYQKTLEIRPDDLDAKYNLELARNRLKEQMKPENKEDQKKQQNQEEKKKEEEGQKDDQGQDKKKDQQEDKSKGEQSPEQQQQQKPQQDDNQQQQPEKMSKEDAMRILRALQESDKENQEKVQRQKVQGSYVGNDW
jgi:Ca-activated chloride channel family protein